MARSDFCQHKRSLIEEDRFIGWTHQKNAAGATFIVALYRATKRCKDCGKAKTWTYVRPPDK